MHIRNITLVILLLTFISCQKEQRVEFDQDIIDLKLANYSMGFLQGKRFPAYDKPYRPNGTEQELRLRSRIKNSSKPIINLCILVDWKHKQSEIIVEPNSFIKNPNEFELLWRDFNGIRGLIFFEEGDRKKHLEFAAQVLDQLERGCEFYLKQDSEYIPILADTISRKAFHITMLDYYGLLKSF